MAAVKEPPTPITVHQGVPHHRASTHQSAEKKEEMCWSVIAVFSQRFQTASTAGPTCSPSSTASYLPVTRPAAAVTHSTAPSRNSVWKNFLGVTVSLTTWSQSRDWQVLQDTDHQEACNAQPHDSIRQCRVHQQRGVIQAGLWCLSVKCTERRSACGRTGKMNTHTSVRMSVPCFTQS